MRECGNNINESLIIFSIKKKKYKDIIDSNYITI